MRKITGITLVIVLMAALGLAGCGGTGVKVSDTGVKVGNTEVETKGGKTTVKSGDTTITTKTPTEAELGVPIYPNAKMDENASVSVANSKGDKEYAVASLWTEDSVDKVSTWYKQKLASKPEYREMPIAEGGTQEMLFTWEEGDKYKTLMVGAGKVDDHPGKTVIVVNYVPVRIPLM
ncbi:MAG: hypothetical protein CVT63_07425 [Candidatus Anoxymicrobium japonicum]|uniref:Lipoprotein n=1 Tax=Candidatus Anoxymicrobium japonicum TaxID=2013648 RepID=A0A2N3G4K3_9ACTN|nr:MAG: hypothetical protein CVT63_07425 [Candidatus Anoxymicrobium japonicum]